MEAMYGILESIVYRKGFGQEVQNSVPSREEYHIENGSNC
jgi:hypothetical protein